MMYHVTFDFNLYVLALFLYMGITSLNRNTTGHYPMYVNMPIILWDIHSYIIYSSKNYLNNVPYSGTSIADILLIL